MAQVKVQLRRDTSTAWLAANPVLAAGEPGVETDTGRFKLGDGVRNWANLPYASGSIPSDDTPQIVGLGSPGTSALYARADHSHPLPPVLTVASVGAESAFISGNLKVGGQLQGGTHQHTTADIQQFDSKVSSRVAATLKAGPNVTLATDTGTGLVTISSSFTNPNAVTSVAGRFGSVTLTTADILDIPSQSGNASKFLSTDGTVYSWKTPVPTNVVNTVAGRGGTVTLTAADIQDLPSPTGNNSKFLTTDGTKYSWATPPVSAGVSGVNKLTGDVTFAAGSNVTLSQSGSTITIGATVSAGTGDVTSVNSLVGALKIATSGPLAVSAAGTTITIDTSGLSTVASSGSYADLKNLPSSFTPSTHTHGSSSITDFTEAVQDVVGAALVGGTGVTVTYDDTANTISVATNKLVAGTNISLNTSTPGQTTISANTIVAGSNVTVDASTPGQTTISSTQAKIVGGTGIAVDSTTPGQSTISVSGTPGNGSYTGTTPPPPQGQIVFTSNPQSVTVLQGSATFSATAINAIAPVYYQWEVLTHGGSDFSSVSASAPYSGSQTPTLVVSPASTALHLAAFRLKVTDSQGRIGYSAAATLSSASLSITRHPSSLTIRETGQAYNVVTSVRVAITGGVPPYATQWQTRTGPTAAWTDMSGKTLLTLQSVDATLASNEALRSTDYRARVTDTAGAVAFSRVATITITADAPEIVADPSNATVSAGSATFAADYKGKGATAVWERKRNIDSGFSVFGASATVTTVSSTVSRSTLTIGDLTPNNVGTLYRLRVTSATGEDVSTEAAVVFASAPVIGVQPVSQTITQSNPVTFSVSATFAGGSPTYQWQELVVGQTVWSNLSGQTSASLTLSSQQVYTGRSGSQFRALVTGGGLVATSDAATLTVVATQTAGDAVFTSDPANASIEIGSSYSLRAVSTWLQSTNHYAVVIVRYDDGGVAYHPLSNGVSQAAYSGAAPRYFAAPNASSTEYAATLSLSKSAFVTVAVSTQPPSHYTVSGSTAQSPPWISYAGSAATTTAYRAGVVSGPLANRPWASGITAQYPTLPPGYVESMRARVEILPRRAFIGPVPTTGFWNPPTSEQFVGAATTNGQNIIALALDGAFGSYLHSSDGGNTWATRNLPMLSDVDDVFCVNNDFYIRLTEETSVVSASSVASLTANVSRSYDAPFLGSTRPASGSTTSQQNTAQSSAIRAGWHRFLRSTDGGLTFSVAYAPRPWNSFANGRWFYVAEQQPGAVSGWAGRSYLLCSASSFDGVASAQVLLHPWETNASLDWLQRPAGLRGVDPSLRVPLLATRVRFAHGRYYVGIFTSANGTAWSVMGNPPLAPVVRSITAYDLYRGSQAQNVTFYLPPVDYAEATLADTTQNYVLADNGFFAPAGTTNWSPVSHNTQGAGPQIGEHLYFGSAAKNIYLGGYARPGTELQGSLGPTGVYAPRKAGVIASFVAGLGMEFFRRPVGNISAPERLFGHAAWSPGSSPPWTDVQIMSYTFGGAYGSNLDSQKWGVTNSLNIPGAIFLPDRMIHIFRAKQTLQGATLQGPPRAR